MSAIAQILINRGINVSGSDAVDSQIISHLREMGAEIKIGHRPENIANADTVIYTAAIAADNAELMHARSLGLDVFERADFLGVLMNDYNVPIAVSGTHGKTTTTAMLSCVFVHAKCDPTVLVGGEYSLINGNICIGDSKYFIFEACEYVDSFLKFNPFAAIVLNIEADHLDYFKDVDSIANSFGKFIEKIPAGGFAVLNADDEKVLSCAKNAACEIITFGASGKYSASDIVIQKDGSIKFTVCYNGLKEKIKLGVKGLHNVSNALAVFATAHNVGIKPHIIAQGIEKFDGIGRRFEYMGEMNGAFVYDDYAHHPTEILATLKTAKGMASGKVWCVFQPHTYTRTKAFFNEFATALSLADNIIVTDIYAAREKDNGEISAEMLAKKIEGALYISDFNDIVKYLKGNVEENDIVITMGAGTITNVSKLLFL